MLVDYLRGRMLAYLDTGLNVVHVRDVARGHIQAAARGRVGERELQGIDLISLDDEGRIRNLDVLMRPLNGIAALRDIVAPQMAEYLARAAPGR